MPQVEKMNKIIIAFLVSFIAAENERNCAVKCLVGIIVNLPFCQNDDKSTETICLLKRESFKIKRPSHDFRTCCATQASMDS